MFNSLISVFLLLPLSLPALAASGVGGGGGGDRPNLREMVLVSDDEKFESPCRNGTYFLNPEDVTPHLNHPTWKNIPYVCIGGSYRRNGVVPKYARCKEGASRYNTEIDDSGNHSRSVRVRYTCSRGRWARNPE